MIDWQTASWIAGVVANGVASIDKIFRGYADYSKQKQPTNEGPPPDFRYQNKPDEKAFVATDINTGVVSQKVTYDELCAKLNPGDRAHVEAISEALENYRKQWDAALVAKSMASGMDVGRYDAQLDYLAREIAKPLTQVLDFVEHMGLWLDDHYVAAREIAHDYLKAQPS